MSLVFKPKIPKRLKKPTGFDQRQFVHGKPFSQNELDLLVELRALNMPLENCGQVLKRSIQGCQTAINRKNLFTKIRKQRKTLIRNVILDLVVQLRALNVPYDECVIYIKSLSGKTFCQRTVQVNNLYSRIDNKRQKLINEVLDESPNTY